jgi:hypothetical protein
MKPRLRKLLNRLKEKRINNDEELREQLERLQMEVGTNKALKISFEPVKPSRYPSRNKSSLKRNFENLQSNKWRKRIIKSYL